MQWTAILLLCLIFCKNSSSHANSPARHSERFEQEILQKSSSSSSSSIFGYQNDLFNKRSEIQLPVYNSLDIRRFASAFAFGAAQAWAYQSFSFYIPISNTYKVFVWDCFCPGDAFDVYLNGNFSFAVGTGCNPGSFNTVNCSPYSSDPTACFNAPGFCFGQKPLNSGFYNLTILVRLSFYGVGIGYIYVTK